jgi:hypothetical protein
MNYIRHFLVLGIFITTTVSAQNSVNYKILKDTPRDVTNFTMVLDLCNVNFPFRGNLDGVSLDMGVWGTGMYRQKFGFDYTMRVGWFTFGRLAGGADYNRRMQIEAGGFLPLISRNKQVSTKVTLASKITSKTTTGETHEITYVEVPAQKWVHIGPRLGLAVYRTVASAKQDAEGNNVGGVPDRANLSSMGLYIGVYRNASRYISISTDTYGTKTRLDNFRWYFDAMIMPVHKFSTPEGVNINDLYSKSPVGFRVGCQTSPIVNRKEAKAPGMDKKFALFCVQIEGGVRAYEGPYISMTWGISLLNLKSKALGYTAPASETRTNE